MSVLDTKVLDGIVGQFDPRVDSAIRETALSAQGVAAIMAPYDTGALSNSLHIEKVQDGVYDLADGVNYGIYNELGTYKMAAHPFVVPAVEGERGRIVSRLAVAARP